MVCFVYWCLIELYYTGLLVVGEVLKTFNPKNQKLLNSSIMLGGEYMKIQAWSGDSAVRQQAKNVSLGSL